MSATSQDPNRADMRLVLPNVPRVGFYGTMRKAGIDRCPEDIAFPACLVAIGTYLGEKFLGCSHQGAGGKSDISCGYAYFMGVSGAGFGLCWNTERWDHGIWNIWYLCDDPFAPICRALDSIGYTYEILGNSDVATEVRFPAYADAGTLRRKMMESIKAGRPVLGFGLVGPPEPGIIAGYDDGGDTIIGWSFFQDDKAFQKGVTFESSGYFRQTGWLQAVPGLILLGEKKPLPPLRQICQDALQWGAAVMRQAGVHHNFAHGIAAYKAWTAALLDEADFQSADQGCLLHQLEVESAAVGYLAEARSYCGTFLRDAAALLPEAGEQLRLAAGCFSVEHDLMWRMWELETPAGPPVDAAGKAAHFARRTTRQSMVDLIQVCRSRDEEALQYIEAALVILAKGRQPSATPPQRALLSKVPYIGWDRSRTGGQAENTYMCAAMKAGLAGMDEPYSYEFLMGVSGVAFRLAWNAERLDGGNISTLCIGDDPLEHYRRAFRAVGWVPKFMGNLGWKSSNVGKNETNIYKGPDYLGDQLEFYDEPAMRGAIVENIYYKRYPVLAVAVVYPPECGVVAGFDEGGDVLIGWNHFQNFPENKAGGNLAYEPTGHFRKRCWFADTVGLILFHYKTVKPPLYNTYQRALEWAVRLIRTSKFRHYYSGLAAYAAWVQALRDDPGFADPDPAARGIRLMCHDDAISCIGEGRLYAAAFLQNMVPVFPAAAQHLLAAAACYQRELTLVEKMTKIVNQRAPASAALLADAGNRQQLVFLIWEAKECEEEAAKLLEAALADIKPVP